MHHEDTTILIVYAPNNRISKYVAKTERTKGKIDKSTAVAGDFITLLSVTSSNRTSEQKSVSLQKT